MAIVRVSVSFPFGRRELESSVMIAVRVYHKEGRWWGGEE